MKYRTIRDYILEYCKDSGFDVIEDEGQISTIKYAKEDFDDDLRHRKDFIEKKALPSIGLFEIYDEYRKRHNNLFNESWGVVFKYIIQVRDYQIPNNGSTKEVKDDLIKAPLEDKDLLYYNYEWIMVNVASALKESPEDVDLYDSFNNSTLVLRHTEQCLYTNTEKLILKFFKDLDSIDCIENYNKCKILDALGDSIRNLIENFEYEIPVDEVIDDSATGIIPSDSDSGEKKDTQNHQ